MRLLGGAGVDVLRVIEAIGPRCLYHFTDGRNLPLIKRHGLLAHAELTARGIQPVCLGGDDASRATDARKGLDSYVHLCFTDDHPMAYVAQATGRMRSAIFLRVSPAVLTTPGALACAVVSNRRDAHVLPLEEALNGMEWQLAISGRDAAEAQGRTSDYELARKYEVLIPSEVPVSMLMDF